MIRPIQQKEDYVHQRDVYTAVFESDLQDVDSTMTGALVRVLGPSSISLCDTVPLPPCPPSPPPSPSCPDDMDVEPAVDAPLTSAVDAPVTSAVDTPITSAVDAPITSAVDAPVTSAVDAPALTTDPIHYFGFEGEEGYSSEEPSDDDFAKKRRSHNRLPNGILGIPGPQERILSIVREAQKKRRVYHSGLEHYVLERWSSAPPGPPGYPKRAKKHRRSVNADQGPRAPGMRPSMDPLEAGHSLVLPSGEKSTLSLSATVLSATVLSATMLSETILSETVLSAIALLPRSSLVLLVFSIPPALMQGHLFDVHSPPLVPHIFPAWVLAILWVLLAIVHGLVIVAHTLLAIVCHLSITRVLAFWRPLAFSWLSFVFPNASFTPPASPHVPPPDHDFPSVQGLHHDWPEPENTMLEDQAPDAQTVSQLPGPVSSDHDHDTSMQVDARQVGLPVSPKDSPIIPSSEFDDLDIRTDDNGQPGTESNETAEASPVNLDPPVLALSSIFENRDKRLLLRGN
ncbi:hypothetical protein BS47DRAFT_1393519 [Hydnum rufescens UP504]|uniref:Transmembrane protein n=1 Tax=Hydnum rufescens UP504 TaxID=1448309 RepID=A0A9P6AW96_9AGAM|nr:hypothetical protein BS47DRAFT_1393519 [Hydnum rufescens UP504]